MTPAKPATKPVPPAETPGPKDVRTLTEEERKKLVDAAADQFMTDNEDTFRDLAK